ncbi:MAG: hypothetical protein IPK68_01345 [Bdellovibrionales bacterium]|nr:hypothetical protein [Bdellovibrionales bacterium]
MRQKRILASYCLFILIAIVPAFEVFSSVSPGACYVMLQPEDTIWDYYVCEGCGSTVSAKPDVHNRQACPNCPKPHTTEAYVETPIVERDGKLFALLPVLSVPGTEENRQALSGKKFNCPWCKSSAFQVDEQCPGCGARFDVDHTFIGLSNVGTGHSHSRGGHASQSPLLSKGGVERDQTSAQNPDLVVKGIGSGSGEAFQEKGTGHVVTETVTEQEGTSGGPFSRRPLKIFGLAAGGLLLATVGGASYWGSLGSIEPGVVTGVTSTQVQIEYADSPETRKTISISPESGEGAVGWRVGEKVRIYLTNWSGPKGAERYNGDAHKIHPPPKN